MRGVDLIFMALILLLSFMIIMPLGQSMIMQGHVIISRAQTYSRLQTMYMTMFNYAAYPWGEDLQDTTTKTPHVYVFDYQPTSAQTKDTNKVRGFCKMYRGVLTSTIKVGNQVMDNVAVGVTECWALTPEGNRYQGIRGYIPYSIMLYDNTLR